jgi:hypothetical protein
MLIDGISWDISRLVGRTTPLAIDVIIADIAPYKALRITYEL